MASQALRVLAVAYKSDATLQDCENDMVFLGLVGMIDPPRPEARAAIHQCEQAGIRPVMITGDHPVTAEAVARELGLLRHGPGRSPEPNWRPWASQTSSARWRNFGLRPRLTRPQAAYRHRAAKQRSRRCHDR